jgi:hypothetical protein
VAQLRCVRRNDPMAKLTQQKWFLVVIGAIVGALVPLISFGLVAFIPNDSAAETFLFPLFIIWSIVSFPGAIFLPSRANATFVLIEVFWIVLGTLAGILIASLRRRRYHHATPNA